MPNKLESCLFCQQRESLIPIKHTFICGDCLYAANKEWIQQWNTLLQDRMNMYIDYCERCINSNDPEDVHQARVTGRKVTSLLQFLNVAKNHPVLLRIKRIHSLLNPIREADVFLDAFSNQKKDVYQELSEKVTTNRAKLQKKLQNEMPELLNNDLPHTWSTFVKDELPRYVLSLDQDARIRAFENRFYEKVNQYHEAAAAHGKQADESIEALHKVRIRSKALRYMYADLGEWTNRDFAEKEAYFKTIQSQFGEINDVQDWLQKLNYYKNKLDAPKTETKNVKKKLEKRLAKMIEHVHLDDVQEKAQTM